MARTEEITNTPTRKILRLVDELVAAVVALSGYPSEYLLVSTEPVARITAGEAKFSEAIS